MVDSLRTVWAIEAQGAVEQDWKACSGQALSWLCLSSDKVTDYILVYFIYRRLIPYVKSSSP
ncbi:MAG: hypothetical protein KME27_03645 [Lyngbya sp. HA4199-MV5]|nr:hypothetical protein [Lyngbya sp. HA4199-MV5]